jgi:formate dehydrogenase subunit gamma
MTAATAKLRHLLAALTVFAGFLLAGPALAQQSNAVNPNASAVKEDQLFQQLHTIRGLGSIPDTKSYTLEQLAGPEWRHYHEVTLRWIGAICILGALAVLIFYYLTRGMIRIESGRSGRTIVRFGPYERFIHWVMATCFVILALSGLNITFGRPLLLLLMSPEAFSTFSAWSKYAHNYLSFPFTISVILMFFMWVADNLPTRVDLDWLKRGGGMIGHDHPPAYRFNAGQKLLFWIVFLGGSAAAISGYVLVFPFYGTDVHTMQLAEIGHSIIAMLFISTMLAHIYIGTIGMEGAFEAMGSGTVDVNWAKEHHELWLEDEEAKARRAPSQAQPSASPGN